MLFTGIKRPEEFRTVTRAHVIAWRDDLARRELGGATIRHRLAALSSLFQYLCDKNAVTHNPVKGVKRPKDESDEGKTPAIGDHQARKLLVAPGEETMKDKRDRAILATLLYHALRREELCKLRVKDFRSMAARRAASEGLRQGREDPLRAAASRRQRADPRIPRGGRTRRPTITARSSGRSATTAPAASTRRSRPDGSTSWCGSIQRRSDSRSAPTRCGRRPRPMRSIIRPISPRSRNGSATRTSPPRGSTITARRGRRTARRSRSRIEQRTRMVLLQIYNKCGRSRSEYVAQ